jgi:hypothetical protein
LVPLVLYEFQNCEDPDGESSAGPSSSHQPQQSRQQQQTQSKFPQQNSAPQSRARMMGGQGSGAPGKPVPSLIRMKTRPPNPQQQSQNIPSQMRAMNTQRVAGLAGNTQGMQRHPRPPSLQQGRGGIPARMRIELPKLNLPMRPMMKRAGPVDQTQSRFPDARQQGFGRGRGRPPRSGGMSLPQFNNNRANSGGGGGFVTITPIMAGRKGVGNLPNLGPPKLPTMKPIRPSDTSRYRQMPQMQLGSPGRGGRGRAMATPMRMTRPRQPFIGPNEDGSFQLSERNQMLMNKMGVSIRTTGAPRPNQQNVQSSAGSGSNISAGGVKGFPQSVVTINKMKFIVMPKGSTDEEGDLIDDEDIMSMSKEEVRQLELLKEEAEADAEIAAMEEKMANEMDMEGDEGEIDQNGADEDFEGQNDDNETLEGGDQWNDKDNEEDKEDEDSKTNEDRKIIMKRLLPYLASETVKNCGSVCKAWRNVQQNECGNATGNDSAEDEPND